MIRAFQLGRMAYDEAHALQKKIQQARLEGEVDDVVLVVEHPPVITLGRSAKDNHLLASKALLESQGVSVHEVGRGGDVTYHGPGQLVVYPIIDLKPDRCDVRKYVWTLEETMIRVCAEYGVTAGRIDKLNGTWVGNNKIGAVGVRLRNWVTLHGFALNVSTDLSHFQWIVPCGISEKGVTSLKKECGQTFSLSSVADETLRHFADLMQCAFEWATPEEVRALKERDTSSENDD